MTILSLPHTLAFGFGSLGTWDMLIILALGLLLFGKRLPDVGKSLGKGIVEFKKGLKGIEDDVEEQSSRPARKPEIPEEKSYRPPLTDGSDKRMSREDVPEEVEQRKD
jgi:sec-independent protein translocase protein TatA